MADGVTTANANTSVGTWTGSGVWAQLHVGPPGPAGTANPSTVTTRASVTWGAPSGGQATATNVPAWAGWLGTSGEQVTDVSFWTLATGGTFEFSLQLAPQGLGQAPGVTMYGGDSLTLSPLTVSIPVAS